MRPNCAYCALNDSLLSVDDSESFVVESELMMMMHACDSQL